MGHGNAEDEKIARMGWRPVCCRQQSKMQRIMTWNTQMVPFLLKQIQWGG